MTGAIVGINRDYTDKVTPTCRKLVKKSCKEIWTIMLFFLFDFLYSSFILLNPVISRVARQAD